MFAIPVFTILTLAIPGAAVKILRTDPATLSPHQRKNYDNARGIAIVTLAIYAVLAAMVIAKNF
jgi:hypothetical protein